MKPYGQEWRRQRKLMHSEVQQQLVRRFNPNQESTTHEFLRRVLDTPNDFLEHIHL